LAMVSTVILPSASKRQFMMHTQTWIMRNEWDSGATERREIYSGVTERREIESCTRSTQSFIL
jgi:hypothetical protein